MKEIVWTSNRGIPKERYKVTNRKYRKLQRMISYDLLAHVRTLIASIQANGTPELGLNERQALDALIDAEEFLMDFEINMRPLWEKA